MSPLGAPSIYSMASFLLIMAALFSCSTPQSLREPDSEKTSPNLVRSPTETTSDDPESDPDYKRAKQFDDFLQGQLEEKETDKLTNECHQNPTDNLFCFSVVNYSYFSRKVEIRKAAKRVSKRRRKRVYPKFKKENVSNWIELRYASVSQTLRGVASQKPKRLELLKKQALEESKCPNNIAISIAATLEDGLPEKSSLNEIGKLYEKGGGCIASNSSDKETMLTRAGLFFFAAKDFESAKRAFTTASELDNTFVARSLYWLQRVQMQEGDTAGANTTIDALKERYPFAFHTLVALIGRNSDPGELLETESTNQIKRSQQMPLINPLIEQVEILNRLGFEDSAETVLNWAVAESQGTEPELRIYLADLKKSQGDYFAKITIMSDVLYRNPALVSKETMELYFPKVFFPVFEKQSKVVDPYLLLSIARRESAFNVKALSHANAQGLLQILPKVRNQILKGKDLFDASDNVAVGARYIVKLLSRLDGQIHLALAGYNAGPSRVTTWLKRYPVADPILFTDLIPYRETREYVASILRNYYWYRRIHLGGDKIPPKQFLELAITK